MRYLPFYMLPYISTSSDTETEISNEALFQRKVTKGDEEGYECIECQDFYPMAELNFPEGDKVHFEFKCYCCRKGLRGFFK